MISRPDCSFWRRSGAYSVSTGICLSLLATSGVAQVNRPAPLLLSRSADNVDIASNSPLAITRGGTIVAIEHGRQALVTMNSQAALVRRIGRKGQGPYEFQSIRSIATSGDTIIALDVGTRRLTLFTESGAGLQMITIDSGAELLELFPQQDGSFIISAYAPVASGTFTKVARGQVAKQPARLLLRVQRDGTTARLSLPADTLSVMRGINCESKAGIIYDVPNAYAPEGPLLAVTSGGYIARAERWAPVVHWSRIGEGSAYQRSALSERPARITDSVWTEMLRPQREREQTSGPLVCNAEQSRRAFMPMIRALAIDDRQRVWATVKTERGVVLATSASGGNAAVAAVLPDLNAPTRIAIAGSLLAILRADSDDVPYVQLFRLRR